MMLSMTRSQSLKEQFELCSPADFPGGVDYVSRFRGLESFLNEQVHPGVTAAASFIDGGFLTDHGPEHIRTVINRASDLLASTPEQALTCYETYLLLAAIHVHDVGNMSGREGHEINSAEVMERLGSLFGPDNAEKRAIFRIAEAHGGRHGTDKDKISKLQERDYLLNQTIRPRFLAALLRFADELADDRTRTSRFQLLADRLPHSSEVFHKYAYALHSVVLSGNSARLEFELAENDANDRFGKGDGEVFLLDEIYERMIKMHTERMYCMRFLRPTVSIDRVDVSIKVYGPGFTDEPRAVIDFRMEEAGYPSASSAGILAICPQLAGHKCGSPPTGDSLKSFLGTSL